MKYSHHQTKYIGKLVGLRTYLHPCRYVLYRTWTYVTFETSIFLFPDRMFTVLSDSPVVFCFMVKLFSACVKKVLVVGSIVNCN